MARRVETVTITAEGRDKGKMFIITEMPALAAERWAYRAMLALAHANPEMPEGAERGGMAAFAEAGIRALNKLDFEEARPLLDEMWRCVQVVPDPKNMAITRPLVMNEAEGDDFEEVETILMMRKRIFDMHTDFFFKGRR